MTTMEQRLEAMLKQMEVMARTGDYLPPAKEKLVLDSTTKVLGTVKALGGSLPPWVPNADNERKLNELAAQFLAHLKGTKDPRASKILARYKTVKQEHPAYGMHVLFADGNFAVNGTAYVVDMDLRGDAYVPRKPGAVRKALLKVLALASVIDKPSTGPGSMKPVDMMAEIMSTFSWFVSIATRELRWQVTIQCTDCEFWDFCNRQACPTCTWSLDSCGMATKK